MFRVIKVIMLSLLFSSVALADDDDWDDDRGPVVEYYQPVAPGYYREEIVYVPERVVEYVPAQPRYYAPPPPPPRYSYDQRSSQGLVGGVVGSVMGYEMGSGSPLATGIGGAAGAWLGNGRY
ncbi:MAG: hypothetical protein PHF31_02925 [Methylobacter sp.]|nr:hypothetical protein [Methylobacter sp.]